VNSPNKKVEINLHLLGLKEEVRCEDLSGRLPGEDGNTRNIDVYFLNNE
jgi:hypothetical protein